MSTAIVIGLVVGIVVLLVGILAVGFAFSSYIKGRKYDESAAGAAAPAVRNTAILSLVVGTFLGLFLGIVGGCALLYALGLVYIPGSKIDAPVAGSVKFDPETRILTYEGSVPSHCLFGVKEIEKNELQTGITPVVVPATTERVQVCFVRNGTEFSQFVLVQTPKK